MNIADIPKKLLVINDLAGIGRCSMSVALPVISACQVQACPFPTAIFSNHLGFPTHYKRDLTQDMTSYMEHLSLLDIEFNGVYCGYLGDVKQMDFIRTFLQEKQNTSNLQVVIDPVMGDHGRRYRSMSAEFCEHMKVFIQNASIITPNITEACLLTNTTYKESGWSQGELQTLGAQLQNLGPKQIVITGMKDHAYFYNYIYESRTSNTMLEVPIAGPSRPGTGDLFASILSALTLRGLSIQDATVIASEFIATCTKASEELQIPIQEGVAFELFLWNLHEKTREHSL